MHDKIKAYQSIMETFIDEFIFAELLREGGFDPVLNPDDIVSFRFKEIDMDNKIKKENQAIQKFNNNAITHEELRMEIGMDPVTDEGRLYFNMVTASLEKLRASSNSVDNAAQPENQNGKKLAAQADRINIKESLGDNGNLKCASYASDLQHQWEILESDVINLSRKYYADSSRLYPNNMPGEIAGVIKLTADAMISTAERYIRLALQQELRMRRIRIKPLGESMLIIYPALRN
jgi:hypothetical protein